MTVLRLTSLEDYQCAGNGFHLSYEPHFFTQLQSFLELVTLMGHRYFWKKTVSDNPLTNFWGQ